MHFWFIHWLCDMHKAHNIICKNVWYMNYRNAFNAKCTKKPADGDRCSTAQTSFCCHSFRRLRAGVFVGVCEMLIIIYIHVWTYVRLNSFGLFWCFHVSELFSLDLCEQYEQRVERLYQRLTVFGFFFFFFFFLQVGGRGSTGEKSSGRLMTLLPAMRMCSTTLRLATSTWSVGLVTVVEDKSAGWGQGPDDLNSLKTGQVLEFFTVGGLPARVWWSELSFRQGRCLSSLVVVGPSTRFWWSELTKNRAGAWVHGQLVVRRQGSDDLNSLKNRAGAWVYGHGYTYL